MNIAIWQKSTSKIGAKKLIFLHDILCEFRFLKHHRNVVKVTCYMANINEFSQMNEMYLEAFGESKPARTTFQVGKLPIGARYDFKKE